MANKLASLVAVTVAVVAVGATSVDAQEIGQQPVGAQFQPQVPAVPASLQDTYERLANFWQSGNAREIAQLARDGRVYVVVQRERQELFDSSDEIELRFPASTHYDADSETAYAVGERVYREGPAEKPRTDRVFAGTRQAPPGARDFFRPVPCIARLDLVSCLAW
jgi:hypothetical protein